MSVYTPYDEVSVSVWLGWVYPGLMNTACTVGAAAGLHSWNLTSTHKHSALCLFQNLSFSLFCQKAIRGWEHSVPRLSILRAAIAGGKQEWGFMWVKLAHEKRTRGQILDPDQPSFYRSQTQTLSVIRNKNSSSCCFSAHAHSDCRLPRLRSFCEGAASVLISGCRHVWDNKKSWMCQSTSIVMFVNS